MVIQIAIPENIVASTRQTSNVFEQEAKQAIAIKFYADGRLSLGQAATLAALHKDDFMRLLGANGVPVLRFEHDAELRQDVENAARFANA